jgi:hypothetical protein
MKIKALTAALKRCSTQNQSFSAACEGMPGYELRISPQGAKAAAPPETEDT